MKNQQAILEKIQKIRKAIAFERDQTAVTLQDSNLKQRMDEAVELVNQVYKLVRFESDFFEQMVKEHSQMKNQYEKMKQELSEMNNKHEQVKQQVISLIKQIKQKDQASQKQAKDIKQSNWTQIDKIARTLEQYCPQKIFIGCRNYLSLWNFGGAKHQFLDGIIYCLTQTKNPQTGQLELYNYLNPFIYERTNQTNASKLCEEVINHIYLKYKIYQGVVIVFQKGKLNHTFFKGYKGMATIYGEKNWSCFDILAVIA